MWIVSVSLVCYYSVGDIMSFGELLAAFTDLEAKVCAHVPSISSLPSRENISIPSIMMTNRQYVQTQDEATNTDDIFTACKDCERLNVLVSKIKVAIHELCFHGCLDSVTKLIGLPKSRIGFVAALVMARYAPDPSQHVQTQVKPHVPEYSGLPPATIEKCINSEIGDKIKKFRLMVKNCN